MKKIYAAFLVIAMGILFAQAPSVAEKVPTQPFTPVQIAQMQEFSKRIAAINDERQKMQRAWDAETKVVQLEYQKWSTDQCKAFNNDQCSANSVDPDSSKWVWALPDKKTPEAKKKE